MDYAPTQAEWGSFKLQLEKQSASLPAPSLSFVQALFEGMEWGKKKKGNCLSNQSN